MNRTLQNMTNALMLTQSVPIVLWPLAAKHAAYVFNLIPNVNGEVPYERFYRKTALPLYKQLRTFGCLAWVHIPASKRTNKLSHKAVPAIFVGQQASGHQDDREEQHGDRSFAACKSPHQREIDPSASAAP